MKYLEFYNMIQDGLLVDHELTDDIQVAPFHPNFLFEGSGPDGIDNGGNIFISLLQTLYLDDFL